MRLRRMLCHLPGGDAMAENSLSSGLWARTGSSELQPTLPRMDEAAASARVALRLTCGRSYMGRQTGWLFLASP